MLKKITVSFKEIAFVLSYNGEQQTPKWIFVKPAPVLIMKSHSHSASLVSVTVSVAVPVAPPFWCSSLCFLIYKKDSSVPNGMTGTSENEAIPNFTSNDINSGAAILNTPTSPDLKISQWLIWHMNSDYSPTCSPSRVWIAHCLYKNSLQK